MKRILVLSTLAAVTLVAPVLAQPAGPPPPGFGAQGGPGGGMGPGMQGGPPPQAVLKEALSLTDSQVSALATLMETRQQGAEALRPQLAAAEQALTEALDAESPDPATLGTLVLQAHILRGQLEKIDATFRQGFTSLLTTEQQAKLAAIEDISKSVMASQVIHQLGL